MVKARGHRFDEKLTLPIVVEDSFNNLSKTKEVVNFLKKIGVYQDIERAENGRKIRAGKGKRRGRKYKQPKSLLVIAEGESVHKSARNLAGVDVVKPDQLNIEHLAPGGVAGRLTLMTLSALKYLGEKQWIHMR